ncbi:DUF2752 domain-containing protein [Acetivibrio mesophilus]|uniref:DUF2752 domain-containing protein n=1 Tax=Acetivibrio mesophilus TaxID=2487273 RepID=A0A4Q0I4Y9_9FIRM|nr:DUF2752 domain-containing protein [Acetivibrio mesophilus]ODM27396.1 hypothetical protein A7W90_14870 [Clostridium sp. Bc-iso-3]RXE59356.1 DUF2752 domain-containing protein [Acetivibrio mesophilus]
MSVNSNNGKNLKIYSYNNRNDVLLILFLFFVILCSFLLKVRDNYTYLQLPGFDFEIPGTCLFKNATGYNCPSCGMTRSFVSISHFDFADALRFNMAGIFAYAWCILELIYRVLRVLTKNNWILLKPIRYLINGVMVITVIFALVNWEIFKYILPGKT